MQPITNQILKDLPNLRAQNAVISGTPKIIEPKIAKSGIKFKCI